MQNENNNTTELIAKNKMVSVVVPAHNEEPGIEETVRVLARILATCADKFEIIVVDDGSADNTFEKVKNIHNEINEVKGIKFSRNFGKEAALLSGLQAAAGDAVITIDADLQHPPEIIPEMVEKWTQGYKVIHAVKRSRTTDSFVARLRAKVFNHLVKLLGGIDIRNSSDYKLLDRLAVDVIVKKLKEHKRFYRGLTQWLGYDQTTILFDVAERNAGDSKWSISSLVGLAITGIISFTSTPLRIVTLLGLATLILAFFVATEALWSWFQGSAVSGFATIIITLLLIGSFIMISLGILGEYVAKIYEEIKSRPDFLIEENSGFKETEHFPDDN